MRITLWLLMILITTGATAAGPNWNQFRGPNGDGKSAANGVPLNFGEQENVSWKTAIHGKGWSSPVVWGDQIWLTTADEDGKRMFAVCVDRETGKVVFDIKVFDVAKPFFCHPTNSYASPTPFIEAGRIYVNFGRYGTKCLDTKTGQTVWERRDFDCNHFRGPGSSPVVFKNLLFLHFDGIDQQYVVALDKTTGKTVWNKVRDIDYQTNNGDRKKAYGTPLIVEFGGRTQLVSPAAVATTAYVPETGDVLWRVRHGGMNAAARPLFAHNLIYLSAGSAGGDDKKLIAVRPGGTGDVTDSHIRWKTGKSVPKRSSQLVVDDLLFMTNDSGIVTCLNAKTGEQIWQERLEGQFWASPIYADGRIYFCSKAGKIPVVVADRKFELLTVNQLDAGFNASPAVAGNSLILRTRTHLYCINR